MFLREDLVIVTISNKYPSDLVELKGYMDIEGTDYGFFDGIINIG